MTINWTLERDGAVDHLGHNDMTTAGLQNVLDLTFAASAGTRLNPSNAYIGVGDSSAPFVAAQTDLQAATNKVRVGMTGGYPSRAAQTVTLRATFGSGVANFAWHEWGLFWGASGANMLSRKVEALGTKVNGQTWILTASVVLA